MIVGSGLSFHNMREFVFKGRGDPKSANTASQVSQSLLNSLPEHASIMQQLSDLFSSWTDLSARGQCSTIA